MNDSELMLEIDDLCTSNDMGIGLMLKDPVQLNSASAATHLRTVRAISLLRELARRGRKIDWSILDVNEVGHELFHLPPPSNVSKSSAWRANFAFGTCYWRKGGRFVMIKDRRANPSERKMFILDEMALVQTFCTFQTARSVDALSTIEFEFLEELVETQLVFRRGEYAVLLPYRMTYWPVPSSLV
ncbi:DUF5825 family protein [Ideonella sp. B508-1]|uniref:DUF5825 family protein n=1 Tax=Ideonella sp. B508-1 TaxID=137716 RepID=UPI0011D2356F|nr:DUF5825 family protein [Ideonella sp. B508-1]